MFKGKLKRLSLVPLGLRYQLNAVLKVLIHPAFLILRIQADTIQMIAGFNLILRCMLDLHVQPIPGLLSVSRVYWNLAMNRNITMNQFKAMNRNTLGNESEECGNGIECGNEWNMIL